jgi:hypothetical protein
MFRALRKRRAIAAYVSKLPRLLLRDYGSAPAYTPAQIKRTLERSGLTTQYDCYAISMFSDRTQFDAYHQIAGETCDYGVMRGEVAAAHFHGYDAFTTTILLDMSADPSLASGADGWHGHDGQ